MAVITDEEFGEVTLQRNALASHVRIRIGTDGRLRASLPKRAPIRLVKRLIDSSRAEIREMLRLHHSQQIFTDGMKIGKSHTITVNQTSSSQPSVKRHGKQIIVSLPQDLELASTRVQAMVRTSVIEALRKDAKSYLPKRLDRLAKLHGFSYQKVRFSHAAGRWGSCSTSGTISLNIALMKLPFPLIDYVLLHELCHTVEMNHSAAFWTLVESCDPNFAEHRRALKKQTPSV